MDREERERNKGTECRGERVEGREEEREWIPTMLAEEFLVVQHTRGRLTQCSVCQGDFT